LRLAFAAFGIITPVVSVVVSVFMLGLGIGAWLAGRAVGPFTRRIGRSAIFLYAAVEMTIGIGAFAVPPLFQLGSQLLQGLGETNSASYLLFSALAIAAAMVPWCLAMGATFPAMMAYVREDAEADPRSFSHLYFANVVGASFGALLTAGVLVEVMGFRHTLMMAGCINFAIAAVAVALGLQSPSPARTASEAPGAAAQRAAPRYSLAILFTTGFAALGMEVVWARAFMPILGTQVYAFAALLVTYLVATWIGSWRYRSDLARGRVVGVAPLVLVVAISALLPAVLPDPRLPGNWIVTALIALGSIAPLCAALGYLTPRLVDDVSGGDPRLAGNAYAVNVLGCILGPLLASYVLLPFVGGNSSIVLLTLPLVAFAIALRADLLKGWRVAGGVTIVGLLAWIFLAGVSYENPCDFFSSRCEVRRDYTATVVARGEGMEKRLLVNGVGITGLTPITKYMAHLPLAMHTGDSRTALVICFGMGTTYRSLLSWGLQTTAVELVPSVRDSFRYFHADAAEVLRNPNGHIVIDDGRRFLERTADKYDVIVVDPPPPVEAAGSSLLYSREFHAAIRRHLNPHGVFQTWFPFGEPRIAAAITSSLTAEFPYVRTYRGIEGWGVHYIASMEPIPDITAQRLMERLPEAARRDIGEWSTKGVAADAQEVLSSQLPVAALMPSSPSIRIADDRPYNEYYLVRRMVATP
jgi:predicted membrane-bound spermidine synthase